MTSTRRRESAALAVLGTLLVLGAGVAGCGGRPPERAVWTIPVPDGTPTHEYPAVSLEERTARVQLERELVVGEAFGAPFYRPRSIAIATDGTIFVLDFGNSRVVAFDQGGKALRAFGRAGEGPGEFEDPDAIGVAGGRVVVNDISNRRLSVFEADGAHVADHVLDERLWAYQLAGFEDHLIAIDARRPPFSVRRPMEPVVVPWRIGVYTLAGDELGRLLELSDRVQGSFLSDSGIVGQLPMKGPHPLGALTRQGIAYATAGDEYQLLAIEASGEPRWALRTDWAPEAVSEARKDAILSGLRDALGEQFEDQRIETSWPDRFAAILNIEVDDRGNLYVFPYLADVYFETDVARQPPSGPVPVDVYSPAGERLFTGLVDIPAWDAQYGGRLCRIEQDPATAEEVVACYRLLTDL